MRRTPPRRSADFQSAVSQNFILHRVGILKVSWFVERPAGCNPAIQQIDNLRYADFAPRPALLHCQSSRAAHSRAFTGFSRT